MNNWFSPYKDIEYAIKKKYTQFNEVDFNAMMYKLTDDRMYLPKEAKDIFFL